MHQRLIRHLTDDNNSFLSQYGGGWLSPDGKNFYVSIPKNASSFLGGWLTENGWRIMNFKDLGTRHTITDTPKLENIVVVLRDPIERFISGFAQYIKGNIIFPMFITEGQSFTIEDLRSHWPAIERIMADVGPFFDDHTWPQYYYHEDILPHIPRKYFWLNPRHIQRLFMDKFGLKEPSEAVLANSNKADKQDPIMSQIQDLIRKTLENPNYLNKIRREFAYDYEYINTTKFIYHK